MRNRAKCKLCNSIIESIERHDYVICKCGEISVSGGTNEFKAGAKNWDNFLRVDDNNNEIIVKVKEKDDIQPVIDDLPKHKPTKEEMLDMLSEMIKTYENLPQNAMTAPISNYDFLSVLMLLSAILRAD